MISIKANVYESETAEVEVTINGRSFRENVYLNRFGSLQDEFFAGQRIVDQMWTHIGEPEADNWEGSTLDVMELIDLVLLKLMEQYKAITKDFGTADYVEGT